MFEHEMLENTEGFVNIEDTDDNVFREMLTYIYTAQIPNSKDYVFGLLPLAEKYQLDHLKAMCAMYLLNNITVENVSNVLILADLYRLTKLKAKAFVFMNANRKKVTATDGYKLLAVSHQHLIVECYEACDD